MTTSTANRINSILNDKVLVFDLESAFESASIIEKHDGSWMLAMDDENIALVQEMYKYAYGTYSLNRVALALMRGNKISIN